MNVHPSDFLELNTGPEPAPSPHESGVRVYADDAGALHSLQSDGTDAPIGGGGSQPVSGFAVVSGIPQDIGNSGTFKPDVLNFASDDWTVDLDNGQFTNDAAGLYLVSCEIRFEVEDGGPADEVWVDVEVDTTVWNVDPIEFNLVPVPNSISDGVWRGMASTVLPLGPVCDLQVTVSRHPYTAMTTRIVENSYLRAFQIADDPAFG